MKKVLIVTLFGILFLIAGCETIELNEAPVIDVESDVYIEVNDTSFNLEDYISITDDNDGVIAVHSSMLDYNNFDPTIVGDYQVELLVSDSEGASASATVTIHVQDLIAPTISINGPTNLQLFVGENYIEQGVIITDNYESDIIPVIEGSVDTSIAGVYELEYLAIDSSGNTSETLLRTVTVLPHTPVVTFQTIVATMDGVVFQLNENDPEQIGEITQIALYQGNTLIQTVSDMTQREFVGLFSNTSYTIEVTTRYDLGDGNGEQTITTSQDFITIALATPTLSLHNINSTKDSVAFEIDYDDEDDVGEITSIELFQGNTLIESLSDLTLRDFSGLLSNNTYTIKVTTTYDLLDGNGVQEEVYTQDVITVAYTAPMISIINVATTTSSLSFDVNIVDVDDIGEISVIELYHDGTLIRIYDDGALREITNLYSNHNYTITVRLTYDLHDGQNPRELDVSYSITTDENIVPTIELSNINLQTNSLSFDLLETDPSNVGTIESIVLFEGDTVIDSLTDTTLREFHTLETEMVYSIRVTYQYDLNDGSNPTTIQLVERRELLDTGIIVHGDFSDTPNANFIYDTGGWAGFADASASIIDEQLIVDITDSGDAFYGVQYVFQDFQFKANTNYVLSFDASSTLERYIDISIGIRPSPIEWIGLEHTSIPIGLEMSHYEYAFTTVDAVNEFAQIVFELGASLQEDNTYLETAPHRIILDNVKVFEINDITSDVAQVYQWFSLVRDENGLHTSSVPGTVYSLYDNALAAIVYTMVGEYEYAEGVFDYFDERIESELQDEWGGFAQIRDLNGNFGDIGNRWLGDNAWLLIALRYYQAQTNTSNYQQLVEALEAWIMSLQNEDGGLSSGYDPSGFMTYPVTEAMIDTYNAFPGGTQFHQDLENYLLQTRVDDEYGILMAWPGHPTYQYSLDTIGWAYLGMDGWSSEILDTADQLFLLEENGVIGYCADIDKDTIFTELSMTMAAAYNKAGNKRKATELMDSIEPLFFQINDSTKGLPYTTTQATGYADFPLWDTVETESHVSGNAWYIFAKMRVNPMKTGLEGKDPFPIDTVWNPELTTAEQVYNWIKNNQLPNGLQKSNEIPAMISLYDNALAAIVYTMYGDYERAEQIFDFFQGIVDTELNDQYGGFAQFHDVDGNIVGGTIGKRWLGDNAWLLVAINQYHYETGTNTYAYMAGELDAWIRSLQNPDGSLSSGLDETGTMMGPVTEAMIDSYNAILGYDDFHRNLLDYFEANRYDAVNNVLVSWPENPPYLYAIDLSSWAFLAMNNVPVSVLTFADQHFQLVENGITGYCIDEDLDSIWTEHSLQMAVAYIHAGIDYQDEAAFIIQNMEQLMIVSPQDSNTMGLPYTTQQATMYGDMPLWEGVDTDIYLSGSAWYLMAMEGYNPFEAGLINKQLYADSNDAFYQ